MKGSTLILLVFFGLRVSAQFQAIPNAGLENWIPPNPPTTTYETPESWWTIEFAQQVTKTTDNHSGQYAARVFPASFFPGIMALNDPYTHQDGIPFVHRPSHLRAWIKYNTASSSDTVIISSLLSKWNSGLMKADTLALAQQKFTGNMPVYTEIVLPYNYQSADQPDSLQIVVYAGNNSGGNQNTYVIADDFSLDGIQTFTDVSLTDAFFSEYTVCPQNQVSPLVLSARVENTGDSVVSGVQLRVDVFQNNMSTNIFQQTSAPVSSLLPGSSADISISNSFTPPGIGFYICRYIVSINELDFDASNDTLFRYYRISNDFFARDDFYELVLSNPLFPFIGLDDTIWGSGIPSDTTTAVFGQNYQLKTPDSLLKVDFYTLGDDQMMGYHIGLSAGDTVRAVIMHTDSAGKPDSILAHTQELIIAANDTGNLTLSLPMAQGLQLQPGVYFIGIEKYRTVNTSFLIAYGRKVPPNTVWHSINDSAFVSDNSSYGRAPLAIWPYFTGTIIPCSLSVTVSGQDVSCLGNCDGKAWVLPAGGPPPYTVSWNNGTIQDTARNLCEGAYTVTVTDFNGCSATGSFSISHPQGSCVWPGDANADGIVDNFDVLNIGIAYGSSGAARQNASLLWQGQPATDWQQSFSNGVNYKHSDCFGDGYVTDFDTLAVALNYGSTHNKTPLSGSPSDPSLYLDLPDTVYAGQSIIAPIYFGTDGNPVSEVYGIAFSINYDNAVFTDDIELSFDDSWMGSPGNDLLGFYKNFLQDGKTAIAITRTNQLNIQQQYGKIATIRFVIKDSLPASSNPVNITIDNIRAINKDEQEIAVFGETATAVALDAEVSIQSINNGSSAIYVYPNPATDLLHIQTTSPNQQIKNIYIYDLNGRIAFSGKQSPIDIREISQGIYFYRIIMNNGDVIRGKFVKR